ncbi:MAG: aminoglycoside 6-adenylyltransferase [Cyanobacteria bacterium J06576_12]
MISQQQLVLEREQLLQRVSAYFSKQQDVVGAFVAGSIPNGSADAYSDIDLRVVATPAGQERLISEKFDMPILWGDWLFNEWRSGTQHCVSHFRSFLKIDVFYWNVETLQPSPFLRFDADILFDRTGQVQELLNQSALLSFPPPETTEISRVMSKALACAHEVIRKAKRGELFHAQALLESLRSYMIQMEDWLCSFEPVAVADFKVEHRISERLRAALASSYAPLEATTLEAATIELSKVLSEQISELHSCFALQRPLENDVYAVELVTKRLVG